MQTFNQWKFLLKKWTVALSLIGALTLAPMVGTLEPAYAKHGKWDNPGKHKGWDNPGKHKGWESPGKHKGHYKSKHWKKRKWRKHHRRSSWKRYNKRGYRLKYRTRHRRDGSSYRQWYRVYD